MKVALVNPFSFSYQGGIQEHVKALYLQLKSKGVTVKVIAPRQLKTESYGPDFLLLGTSVVVPGNDSRISLSYSLPQEVEAVVRREQFDLVHFHSFLPFLPFQILDFLGQFSTAKILTSHSNMEGAFVATAFGVITDLVIDSFIGRMDGVISVSRAAERLAKRYRGRKVIIPNGIDLKRFGPWVPKRPEFLDGKINILFVGRLDPRKGPQVLLPAFVSLKKRYRETRLIIIGDGFLRETLKTQASRAGLSDVIFVGEVKAEETPSYYATADIFCAPSLRGETFGIILLEAMASGLPVLASDIDGYREVMPAEAVDCLVPPNDPVVLALALGQLVDDKKRRMELSQIGLQQAENYAWPIIGQKILEFYEEVLAARASRSQPH